MDKDRTSDIPSENIGKAVDAMIKSFENQRKSFERRWYDNNFFDDGYHFRYVSRSTNRIIDLSERQNVNLPQRALPKASRQIRGVANLLLQLDPTPIIYPEKVNITAYQEQELQQAKDQAKDVAKKIGHWLKEEWKKMHFKDLLTYMVILATKHGVSFMQIWPDAVKEKINAQVFDAFDIYLQGNLTSIYDSPAIIKSMPKLISQIKANELFDEEAKEQLSPDNKFASSEVKEAYMNARYATGSESDYAATLLEKEAFIKEYLNSDNWAEVSKKSGKSGVMEGKSKGDMVMRHSFSTSGITLLDEYIDVPDYPFVDFRFEPGPIYQVSLLERFIPLNKSLDIIASRIERYANTMVSGTWLKRRGEDFQINNLPGGQVLEYTATPPTQANIASIPPFMFNYLSFLEKLIEEQGASTSALGQLPEGVKSGIAIESMKATEYANLKIASNQLKNTARMIAEKMIDVASKYFIKPQTVFMLEKGEPTYYDVIGQYGVEARRRAGMNVPNATPIKSDYIVDIDVESGLGYTTEGKKASMQQIIQFISELAKNGMIPQPAVVEVVKRFLEVFQFGSTEEFMEAIDKGQQEQPMGDQQLMQMKVAILEALKEAGEVGEEASQKRVQESALGALQAIKDSGLIENTQNKEREPEKGPSKSISFKDLPDEGKVQLAGQAGIRLSPEDITAKELKDKVMNQVTSSQNTNASTQGKKRQGSR